MRLPKHTTHYVNLFVISFVTVFALVSGQLTLLHPRKGIAFTPEKIYAVKNESSTLSSEKSVPVVLGAHAFLAPKVIATPTPTVLPVVAGTSEWGKATQIDEHTWTMKVAMDDRMATPGEILEALNSYRAKNGRGGLSWDDKLAELAQSRAARFTELNSTDGHAGFQDYMNNDGFHKAGFYSLGENSSWGYKLVGVHIIEWVYAADQPHNDNQLNPQWSHVGIGVNGVSTDLIFGGRKM